MEQGFYVRIGARVDQYVAALNQAKAATTGFTSETSRNLQKVGGDLQKVGGWMTTRVTLPIIAAGGAATKMGFDFQDSFTKMVNLAGVAAGEVDGLQKSVLDLARETGRMPQELADALYFARSAGLDASNAMDTLEVSARAAALGMGRTEEVVGLNASALAAYGSDVLSAAEATDILVATVRAGRADPDELAGSLGRILPIASQLGVEFDEVGGATAYLSNIFGDTGRTVTAMSGFLAKLVAPTKQGRQALADMGTSVEELQRVLSEDGLLAALDLLREKGFAQNQQALRALFDDIEGYQGALALLNDANGQLVPTMQQVQDSAGSLGDAYEQLSETDAQKLRKAWAGLISDAVQLGAVLLPLAADAFGPLVDVISDVVHAVLSLPEPLRNVVLGMVAATAAAGPMIMVGGTVVRNFESMVGGARLARDGLVKLGMTATTATTALGVLGVAIAAVGAAYAIYRSFGASQREVAARAAEVSSGLDEATDAVIRNAEATDGATLAAEALSNVLTQMGDDGSKLTEALGTLGSTTGESLETLIDVSKRGSKALYELGQQAGLSGVAAAQLATIINQEEDWKFIEDRVHSLAVTYGYNEQQLLAVARALEEVQDQGEKTNLDDILRPWISNRAAMSDMNQELLAQAEAMTGIQRTGDGLLPLYEAYVQLLAENKDAAGDTATATEAADDALSDLTETTDEATTSASDLVDVLRDQTTVFEQLEAAARGVKSAIDLVLGGPMSMEDATRSWEEGVDRLTESVKKNGKTLDVTTEKGRANRKAVEDQVRTITSDLIPALVRQGMSMEDATAWGLAYRDSLIEQMTQLGLTREEAEGYVNQLGLTPENVQTAVELYNEQTARQHLEDLLGTLGEIPDEVATAIKADIANGDFDAAENRIRRLQALAQAGASVPVTTYNAGGGVKVQADGGYHSGPTMALLGEAGDEVVLPLTRPGRMAQLLQDPRVRARVLQALSTTMPHFAAGGVISSKVLNAGGAASKLSPSDVMAAKFEMGEIGAADYRSFLEGQLGAMEKYSAEYMQVWRQINQIDTDNAAKMADQQAKQDELQRNMFETGALSAQAYEQYLQSRLSSFEMYSREWMAAWRELKSVQDEELRSAQEAEDTVTRSAYDRAKAQADLAQAERDLAAAISDADEAEANARKVGSDRTAKAEDKARANGDAQSARQRVADVAFAGAGARAVEQGYAPGTTGWAQFVRREVADYAAAHPELAGRLDELLVGVPSFARGGYVSSRPGGMLARVADGGEGEWMIPNSRLVPVMASMLAMGGAATPTDSSGGVVIHGGVQVGTRQDLGELDQRLRSFAWRARKR